MYLTCSICVYFQLNPVVLPQCEKYYREQGYDFKIQNGRVVLVRRTRHLARRRRQGQVGRLVLTNGEPLTIQPIGSSDCLFPSCGRTSSLWTRVTPCRSSPVRGPPTSPSPGPAWDWSECWRGRGLGSLWTTSRHRWITSW